MALINCPNCNNEVSDKATFCPNCNYALQHANTTSKKIICGDCKQAYIDSLSACPNCGCPKPQKGKKNMILVIIAMFVIFSVIFVLNSKIQSNEYYENAKNITITMAEGATNAEKIGNTIISVWGNSIYKRKNETTDKFTMKNGKFVDDFNDALSNLYSDEEFNKTISDIQKNRNDVMKIMRKLKNPPQKYNELYSVIKALYEDYSKFTKFVIDSKGSYNSFSENFNTYDNELAETYEKALLCFD